MTGKLVPLYREMAAEGGSLRGLSILRYADEIGQLVRKHRAARLLDYGCGAGDAYKQPHRLHREWGLKWFEVKLYDPAFPEHSERPHGFYDGVICSDVMEHIPEDEVDITIATLFTHARKFVWASICCRPAKKAFADGTNLHCTLHPMEWWRERFQAAQDAVREARAETVAFYLVESP